MTINPQGFNAIIEFHIVDNNYIINDNNDN